MNPLVHPRVEPRVMPRHRSLLVLAAALAVACGSAQQPGDGSDALGPTCTTRADCAANEECASPEERSWNFCGMPLEVDCPDGHFADSYGNCFLGCDAETRCPDGQTCNGSYCISTRHCAPMRPPPP